jgi:hypothetical protein
MNSAATISECMQGRLHPLSVAWFLQEGNTPLHLAAMNGKVEVVNALIKRMNPETTNEAILKKNNVRITFVDVFELGAEAVIAFAYKLMVFIRLGTHRSAGPWSPL